MRVCTCTPWTHLLSGVFAGQDAVEDDSSDDAESEGEDSDGVAAEGNDKRARLRNVSCACVPIFYHS